jgi:mono/diheme cytochrome c family protein
MQELKQAATGFATALLLIIAAANIPRFINWLLVNTKAQTNTSFYDYYDNPISTSYTESPGKLLFEANCKSCHAVHVNLSGPALAGIEVRVPDKKLLYAWIRNPQAVLAKKNSYFTSLYEKWNKTPMNSFRQLTDAEIEDILAYIKETSAIPF